MPNKPVPALHSDLMYVPVALFPDPFGPGRGCEVASKYRLLHSPVTMCTQRYLFPSQRRESKKIK